MEPTCVKDLGLVDGDIVLCYSGGIDSFLGVHYLITSNELADRKIIAVYFNLGSRYSAKELKYARELIANGKDNVIIDDSLSWLGRFELGEKAFVPYRNLYLAMTASAKYAPNVCICGLKDDAVEDKNKEVFELWSRHLTEISRKSVNIFSPFWDMTKSDIVSWYLASGGDRISLLNTVSCYSSADTVYCGMCNCCFRKWVALWSNGIQTDFLNPVILDNYESACMNGHYDKQRRDSTLKAITEYRGVNETRKSSAN